MKKLYDLCITGGGAAGCAAAFKASKLGLKTALIEKNNYLGGLMTGGLVVPVMKTDDEEINTEFFNSVVSLAKQYNAQIEYFDLNKGWFNPEILKIVLDEILIKNGVDIFFELEPNKVNHDRKKITSIEYSSNLLSLYIESKYYIDSTGDAKIFKLAGQNFFEEKNKKQSVSLRFTMENVDVKKLRDFLIEIDPNRNVTNFAKINGEIHLTTAYTWDNKGWNLKPLFEKAVNDGVLSLFDTAYFQIFTVAGAKNQIAFNCPRLRDYNENDPLDFSKALIEARTAIKRISNFVIKYFKGFENAYISKIADITGRRETNKIIAKEQFTFEKANSNKPQKPIVCSDYPIDIHSNKKNSSILNNIGKYYMTINSLLSKDFENLYAAGRNAGTDSLMQAALRTQKSCMSMGEGIAAEIFNIIKKC